MPSFKETPAKEDCVIGGRLPGLHLLSGAQERKVKIICGTLAGMIEDSNCTDLERKAIVSSLVQHYGTLEQLSVHQRAAIRSKRKTRWHLK